MIINNKELIELFGSEKIKHITKKLNVWNRILKYPY
jgi:hypothetical protein